jgi:uncharacterized protein (DUF697 family)
MMQVIARTLQDGTNAAGEATVKFAYPAIEEGTEFLGRTVAPIADLPLIKYATAVPGIKWLLAALGQVNTERVVMEVEQFRLDYPLDSQAQLAQRVMLKTSQRAAQVGLVTNFIPPVALMLFAVDIGAIAALQAEMIYRIAAIYGFSPKDSTRRGEVLSIWALTTSSWGFLKSGLSFLEILPGLGTVVGITADAAIVYGVGFLACRYYEMKQFNQKYHSNERVA